LSQLVFHDLEVSTYCVCLPESNICTVSWKGMEAHPQSHHATQQSHLISLVISKYPLLSFAITFS